MAIGGIDLHRPGVWAELLPAALSLMAHLESQTHQPLWTFGGGTVLMLRIGHRQSKDIDLFVPDPQYLGYINPRLSDVAEQVSADYQENAEFIKFFLPAGEIDIVVGQLASGPTQAIQRLAGCSHAAPAVLADAVPPGPAGLLAQVAWVVQRLGKSKARRYLRDKLDLALVPAPELLGV